jgi:hypothetical protein
MRKEILKIVQDTHRVIKIMREEYASQIREGEGVNAMYEKIQAILPDVYLRPNNIIDLGRYSKTKIEETFKEMGFEFRKEMEGKLHYFNPDTSVSIYLNPQNKKLTLVP